MSMAQKLTTIAENQQKVYDAGKEQAVAQLPAGYLKIDPAWNSWYMLFNGRPSMGQFLKYEDSANVQTMTSAFQSWTGGSYVVPSLDMRKVTTMQNMFIYSSGIVEIGEMDISGVTNANLAFNGCSALQRISFVPGCIKVPISFIASNLLDDASVQSVIDGLADMTDKSPQTLTFHPTVGAKLTQQQKAQIQAKNWELIY